MIYEGKYWCKKGNGDPLIERAEREKNRENERERGRYWSELKFINTKYAANIIKLSSERDRVTRLRMRGLII